MKIALHKSPSYVANDKNVFGRFEIRLTRAEFAALGCPARLMMDRDDGGLYLRPASGSPADARRSAALTTYKIKTPTGTRQSPGRRAQLRAALTPLAGMNRFKACDVATEQGEDELFGGPKLRFRLLDAPPAKVVRAALDQVDSWADQPAKMATKVAEVKAAADTDTADDRETLRGLIQSINHLAARLDATLFVKDGQLHAHVNVNTVMTL